MLRTNKQNLSGTLKGTTMAASPSADHMVGILRETIVALVASDQPESELKQFLLERLPDWQVPRDWQLVDSLPSNGRGKLSRSECRRRWLAATTK